MRHFLGNPNGVSSDGTHVWVTTEGDTVTELDASTGALVRVIKGSKYDLGLPYGVFSNGTQVWIANEYRDSVTELDASTGALVRVIKGSK